jgi:transcription initiation factor TFIIIB Brf1 subunit/transcription initiation factor TFIIB
LASKNRGHWTKDCCGCVLEAVILLSGINNSNFSLEENEKRHINLHAQDMDPIETEKLINFTKKKAKSNTSAEEFS